MKNITTSYSILQRMIAKVIIGIFLFTTIFSSIPGTITPAFAEGEEVTYTTEYTYDLNGNVETRKTPDGDTIQYDYDSLNRITKATYPDLSEVNYVYDANGNRIEVTDSHGTTYYGYDRFNRLTGVQISGINPTYYEYDNANNLTKITYASGEEVSYEYDDDNRLTSVTDATGTTTYEYDNQTNNLWKKTLPNGVITEHTYDSAKRITDVVNKKADETLISSYHYEFDDNNNRTQVVEATQAGSKTTDYTYDNLNRLLTATCSDGTYETYTYDSTGNRLTKETQAGTIDYEYDQDNRLLSAGNTFFFYDQSGNLIQKISPDKTTDYTYDYENRLIEYYDGTNTVTFEYNGDGNRISKTVNGVQTKYINDVSSPITQVLIETTSDYYVLKRYAYGHSRLNQSDYSTTSYYLYDNPGRSVAGLVGNSQTLLNTYEYDAFGNIKAASEATGNSFKYVGEQYDEETGLIFLRNRYYDPEVGRFISKDPFPGYVQVPQTKNPYLYCRGNPMNCKDPLGLIDEEGVWAAAEGFAWDISKAATGTAFILSVAGAKEGAALYYDTAFSFPANLAKLMAALNDNPAWRDIPTSPLTWIAKIATHNATEANKQLGYDIVNILEGVKDLITFQAPSTTIEKVSSFSNSYNYGELIVDSANRIYDSCTNINNSNYGGVSLSKTASLMLDINDIAGATYDEGTGQVILFGQEDLSLPAMELDDLAVAVRSVYGFGGQDPQDPGVSIGTEKSGIPGQMKVLYDGQTFETAFGHTMFESDRTLKILTLGKDNITGNPVTSGVSGYMNMPERYAAGGGVPGGQVSDRMWFVPQEISLIPSPDGTSMLFDTVAMELLTESRFEDDVADNPVAEAFATHFTDYYDDFAADTEFPILKELKRLGKITSVVKWIKDKEIPFDLSFFESYQPSFHSGTPEYTPETSNTSTDGTVIATGGVKYLLDASNFSFTDPDLQVDQTKQAALSARMAETDFQWDFSDGGENYKAIAHSLTRAKKDGSVKRAEVDMSFPVEGNNPLALVRYYNSFNDKTAGFGYGWGYRGRVLIY